MNLTRLSRTCPATYFVGVFLLALMTTLGCNHQEQSPHISRPVKVARIVDQTDTVMSFAGDVRARYETMLSFRVAGKLLARHVDVGDRVREGQVLARLDQNDYRLAVQDLQAQVASAVAGATAGPTIIFFLSLFLMLAWDKAGKRSRVFELVPGPLAVVAMGIGVNQLFASVAPALHVADVKHLVKPAGAGECKRLLPPIRASRFRGHLQ